MSFSTSTVAFLTLVMELELDFDNESDDDDRDEQGRHVVRAMDTTQDIGKASLERLSESAQLQTKRWQHFPLLNEVVVRPLAAVSASIAAAAAISNANPTRDANEDDKDGDGDDEPTLFTPSIDRGETSDQEDEGDDPQHRRQISRMPLALPVDINGEDEEEVHERTHDSEQRQQRREPAHWVRDRELTVSDTLPAATANDDSDNERDQDATDTPSGDASISAPASPSSSTNKLAWIMVDPSKLDVMAHALSTDELKSQLHANEEHQDDDQEMELELAPARVTRHSSDSNRDDFDKEGADRIIAGAVAFDSETVAAFELHGEEEGDAARATVSLPSSASIPSLGASHQRSTKAVAVPLSTDTGVMPMNTADDNGEIDAAPVPGAASGGGGGDGDGGGGGDASAAASQRSWTVHNSVFETLPPDSRTEAEQLQFESRFMAFGGKLRPGLSRLRQIVTESDTRRYTRHRVKRSTKRGGGGGGEGEEQGPAEGKATMHVTRPVIHDIGAREHLDIDDQEPMTLVESLTIHYQGGLPYTLYNELVSKFPRILIPLYMRVKLVGQTPASVLPDARPGQLVLATDAVTQLRQVGDYRTHADELSARVEAQPPQMTHNVFEEAVPEDEEQEEDAKNQERKGQQVPDSDERKGSTLITKKKRKSKGKSVMRVRGVKRRHPSNQASDKDADKAKTEVDDDSSLAPPQKQQRASESTDRKTEPKAKKPKKSKGGARWAYVPVTDDELKSLPKGTKTYLVDKSVEPVLAPIMVPLPASQRANKHRETVETPNPITFPVEMTQTDTFVCFYFVVKPPLLAPTVSARDTLIASYKGSPRNNRIRVFEVSGQVLFALSDLLALFGLSTSEEHKLYDSYSSHHKGMAPSGPPGTACLTVDGIKLFVQQPYASSNRRACEWVEYNFKEIFEADKQGRLAREAREQSSMVPETAENDSQKQGEDHDDDDDDGDQEERTEERKEKGNRKTPAGSSKKKKDSQKKSTKNTHTETKERARKPSHKAKERPLRMPAMTSASVNYVSSLPYKISYTRKSEAREPKTKLGPYSRRPDTVRVLQISGTSERFVPSDDLGWLLGLNSEISANGYTFFKAFMTSKYGQRFWVGKKTSFCVSLDGLRKIIQEKRKFLAKRGRQERVEWIQKYLLGPVPREFLPKPELDSEPESEPEPAPQRPVESLAIQYVSTLPDYPISHTRRGHDVPKGTEAGAPRPNHVRIITDKRTGERFAVGIDVAWVLGIISELSDNASQAFKQYLKPKHFERIQLIRQRPLCFNRDGLVAFLASGQPNVRRQRDDAVQWLLTEIVERMFDRKSTKPEPPEEYIKRSADRSSDTMETET